MKSITTFITEASNRFDRAFNKNKEEILAYFKSLLDDDCYYDSGKDNISGWEMVDDLNYTLDSLIDSAFDWEGALDAFGINYSQRTEDSFRDWVYEHHDMIMSLLQK